MSRPRRSHRHPGYKLAIEVLIVALVVQGAFFVIDSYKKGKAVSVKAKTVKRAALKPPVVTPKAAEAPRPELAPEPKPAPEIEARPAAKPVRAAKAPVLPAAPVPPPRPKAKAPAEEAAPAGSQGRIAIVLDDWGYTLNNLPVLDGFKYPVTAAILPNLRYSSSVAQELHKRGVEIILHLPMEPQSRLGMEKDTILVTMDDAQIEEILGRDLGNIVYARGINNHMGSRATEDPRVMEAVFRELKKHPSL